MSSRGRRSPHQATFDMDSQSKAVPDQTKAAVKEVEEPVIEEEMTPTEPTLEEQNPSKKVEIKKMPVIPNNSPKARPNFTAGLVRSEEKKTAMVIGKTIHVVPATPESVSAAWAKAKEGSISAIEFSDELAAYLNAPRNNVYNGKNLTIMAMMGLKTDLGDAEYLELR